MDEEKQGDHEAKESGKRRLLGTERSHDHEKERVVGLM
jgi:hypothetical protein